MSLRRIIKSMLSRRVRDFLIDYLSARDGYKQKCGKSLSLLRPRYFTEKLQWIKLFDRNPYYSLCADKYAVRQIVEQKIGKQYLIPLLGVYDRAEDIDLDSLPDSFVLKATHGSGWNVLCKDKTTLDWDEVRKQLNKWLTTDYYADISREWVYKNITPRIVCEELLRTEDGGDLQDYKFHCFDGEPLFIHVDIGRFGHHTRNIYNQQWEKQSWGLYFPISERTIRRPEGFDEMLDIARRLSRDIPFARVDMYYVNAEIRFSEITFYPANGFEPFHPRERDLYFGGKLKLRRTKFSDYVAEE